MPNNKNSMSFLEGKLKAEKLNQNHIQQLFEAWEGAIIYEKICSRATANPKKDFDYEKRVKLHVFLVKKSTVDSVYDLRQIFTNYQVEYNRRYDADLAINYAKASLTEKPNLNKSGYSYKAIVQSTETSAIKETWKIALELKKTVVKLEEAAIKAQIDSQEIAALVTKVDELRQLFRQQKDSLPAEYKTACLVHLAKYIKKSETNEKEKSTGFFRNAGNTLRRSFSRKKTGAQVKPIQPDSLEIVKSLYSQGMNAEPESIVKKRLQAQYEDKYSKLSLAQMIEFNEWTAQFTPYENASDNTTQAGGDLNAVGDNSDDVWKDSLSGTMSAATSGYASHIPHGSTSEDPLQAWGDDTNDYRYHQKPTVDSVFSLYQDMMQEQTHSLRKKLEKTYEVARKQLSKNEQAEFYRRLESLHVPANVSPVTQCTAKSLVSPLDNVQTLFRESYNETDSEKKKELQSEYKTACQQLEDDDYFEFLKWTKTFKTGIEIQGDDIANAESLTTDNDLAQDDPNPATHWNNNHSTFFSAPTAVHGQSLAVASTEALESSGKFSLR